MELCRKIARLGTALVWGLRATSAARCNSGYALLVTTQLSIDDSGCLPVTVCANL
jgi:hypothetical protein